MSCPNPVDLRARDLREIPITSRRPRRGRLTVVQAMVYLSPESRSALRVDPLDPKDPCTIAARDKGVQPSLHEGRSVVMKSRDLWPVCAGFVASSRSILAKSRELEYGGCLHS